MKLYFYLYFLNIAWKTCSHLKVQFNEEDIGYFECGLFLLTLHVFNVFILVFYHILFCCWYLLNVFDVLVLMGLLLWSSCVNSY